MRRRTIASRLLNTGRQVHLREPHNRPARGVVSQPDQAVENAKVSIQGRFGDEGGRVEEEGRVEEGRVLVLPEEGQQGHLRRAHGMAQGPLDKPRDVDPVLCQKNMCTFTAYTFRGAEGGTH